MCADVPTWSPTSLDEALSLLAAHAPEITVVAGGTDLMVYLQARVMTLSKALNIWGVDELRGVRVDGDELVIGALEPYRGIIASRLVQQHAPTLVAASKTVGAVQIQNRGTLGGNFANASPAADTPPMLLAANATLTLASTRGTRTVESTGFFHGYKQLELRPDELITEVRVPCLGADERSWFQKVGTRRAQAISKVVMGGRARYAADGTVASVGLAVGSVAAMTVRLPQTEAIITGQRPSAELEEAVRTSAAAEVTPIDDVRSTAEYRRVVTGNIAARFVRYLMGNP